MDTIVIRKLLKRFKCFKGVYSSNNIPVFKKYPIHIIVNTDPSYKKGSHWVAITIKQNGRGEYFDSFGLPPLVEDIFNYLEKHCFNGWTYNKNIIQHVTSKTCGHYCVMYIIYKCSNKSLKSYIKLFSENKVNNDLKLKQLFEKVKLKFFISI